MASRPRDGMQMDDAARRHWVAEPATPETSPMQEQIADPGVSLQHALVQPGRASPASVLSLGQSVGNRAVSRHIQAKLMVGAAGDRYEQEADRVADQVLSMPAPLAQGPAGAGTGSVQRQGEEEELQAKPLSASITPLIRRQPEDEEEAVQTEPAVQRQGEEEEELQAKPLAQRAGEEEELQVKPLVQHQAGGGFWVSPELECRLAASRGGGSPLSPGVRAAMEHHFGADLHGVRVHTNPDAAQLSRALGAQAFTHGADIYMGEGRYHPGTTDGKRLLAHELAHVVQQGAAPVPSVQSRRAQAGGQPVPVAEAGAADRGLLQRVVVPYKQEHRDWNLAERQATGKWDIGFSPPWLNGTVCTSAQATRNALVKPQITVTPKGKDQYQAEVYSAPVNIAGSEMWLPTRGPWLYKGANKDEAARWAGMTLKRPGGTCTVEVTGIPDYKALASQIEAHENVHASDNKRIIDQVLGQWDAKIHKAQAEKTKFAGGTADEAREAVFRYIGGTAEDIGTRLDTQWGQASDAYHDTPEGKTKVDGTYERGKELILVFHLTSKV
jgi:hypothetical protein